MGGYGEGLTEQWNWGIFRVSGTENAQGALEGAAGSAPRLNQIFNRFGVFPRAVFCFYSRYHG
jgi:hypothetical protein